jgi:protein-tyrosine phosphatase
VLWHCSAGKDRAGWVGTSVLLGLGAEPAVIVDHYVESNRHLRGIGALFPDGELKDLLRPYLEVHEDFVRAQLDVVDRQWGGRSALYRDGFGLSDDVIGRFIAAAVDAE